MSSLKGNMSKNFFFSIVLSIFNIVYTQFGHDLTHLNLFYCN